MKIEDSPELFDATFSNYYNTNGIRQVRGALGVAAFLYGVFQILDHLVLVEVAKDSIFYTRWGVTALLTASATIIQRRWLWSHRYIQLIQAIAYVVGSLGMIRMVYLISASGHAEVAHLYYAGILLAIMWAHGFLWLRFRWALPCTLFISAVYLYTILALVDSPQQTIWCSCFFLGSAVVVGSANNVLLEKSRERVYNSMLHINQIETTGPHEVLDKQRFIAEIKNAGRAHQLWQHDYGLIVFEFWEGTEDKMREVIRIMEGRSKRKTIDDLSKYILSYVRPGDRVHRSSHFDGRVSVLVRHQNNTEKSSRKSLKKRTEAIAQGLVDRLSVEKNSAYNSTLIFGIACVSRDNEASPFPVLHQSAEDDLSRKCEQLERQATS